VLRTVASTIRRTARDRFGWRQLRPGQVEAVRALLKGNDVLVVMPTGAGKSAVYQLAALLIDGPTVVVSPLIALQRDQLASLAKRGDRPGLAAVAVNSAQGAGETHQAWESLSTGDAEFVFLAPEQLANDEVVDRLAKAGVSLLVVDEAHCVSAWGHDFRPDYLRIGDVIERLGSPTVVALTATAAPPVRAEIMERLHMRKPTQIIQGFDRPNLRPEVHRYTDKQRKQNAVLDKVLELSGSGLVYTATRKDTEFYAEALIAKGRKAAAYHAGIKAADRERVHTGFLSGEIEVVVATSAFGMGIDKPEVRFVVHAEVSESLDSYYQEIGRAGRDGRPAPAILFYRSEDLGLRNFFASGGSDPEVLASVAGAVRRITKKDGAVEPSALKEELELSHTRLTNAVNLLEQAGAVNVDGLGRLHYTDDRLKVDTAVEQATEVAEAHTRVDRSRVEMMRGYAETVGCRRQFLLGYFGEDLPKPCGNCDTCSSGSAAARDLDLRDAAVAAKARTAGASVAKVGVKAGAGAKAGARAGWRLGSRTPAPTGPESFALNAPVEHREWGPGVVMRQEPDRITVLFEQVGYRTLALVALQADSGLLVARPLA
jgi:ATP-dependent DNA helicase RecQ